MKIGMEIQMLWLLDIDCTFEEFILNWNSQVPHWYYLTDAGINEIKGTRGLRYKRYCDEIL